MNSNQQKHTNRVLSTVISLAILTVLLFSTAVGFAEEEQKKTIKAATNGKPAPYVTISDKGEIDGYDIAVLRAVFEKLPQYELEIIVADDSLTGLISGLYQLSVNNWSYRPERAETYYFSYPYNKIRYDFIQRENDEPLTSLKEASERGYRIEVTPGNNVTSALEAWNESNPDAQIQLVYTEADSLVLFQHVVDGVADFRIVGHPVFKTYVDDFNLPLQGNGLSEEEAARISTALNAYILFPKDEAGAALREDVNAAIKAIYEDGTIKELSQKYFGIDQSPDASEYEKTLN